MEVPKILWLKKHVDAARFSHCQFFDLPDFFTYKCTGDNTRSFCSTTCKCSFVPDKGWQEDFFTRIGLAELIDGGEWKQIGAAKGRVKPAGSPIGQGLTEEAAKDLGLLNGTSVGSGLIDALAFDPCNSFDEALMIIEGTRVGWVQLGHGIWKTDAYRLLLLLTSHVIGLLLSREQARATLYRLL